MSAWHAPGRLTGMAMPLAVWALHFVALYALQGLACARGWGLAGRWGLPGFTWAALGLTALALVVIAWLGARAWRAMRPPSADTTARAARFTRRLTLGVAAMAAVAVIFTLMPVLLLAPCE